MAYVWNIPKTWTGTLVTVDDLNTHIRDQFRALAQAVQVYLSSNVNHTSSGSFQIFGWDLESVDTNALHTVNSTRLTAAVAGNYWVYGQFAFNATATTVGARILLNGATYFDNRIAGANTNGQTASIGMLVPMVVNDYVEFAALQNSGGTLAVLGGIGGAMTFFGMHVAGGATP